MDRSQLTGLTALALSIGTIAVGVLNDNDPGSLFLGEGNVVFDSALNNAPSINSNSGALTTWRYCDSTQSRDGCTVTGSGCYITNPYDGTDHPMTASAAIVTAFLNVTRNPRNARWDIGPVKTTTASGETMGNSLVVGSGSFTIRGSTGSYVVPGGGGLNFRTTVSPGSNYLYRCGAQFFPIDTP